MKLLQILLLSCLSFLLIQCGSSQAITTSNPTTTSETKDLGENYQVWDGNTFVSSPLEKTPDFSEGSYRGYYEGMYKQIRYPAEARERGVGGTVWVELIVNEFGMMDGARVKQGIGNGCDEEALKIVRLVSSKGFSPAIKDGKPVKVKFDIAVKFRLE